MAKKKSGKKDPKIEKPKMSDTPVKLQFPDTADKEQIERWAKENRIEIPIEFVPPRKAPKRKKTSKSFNARMKIIKERRKKFQKK